MASPSPDVVVAGHICLDIIPDFTATVGSLRDLMRPGQLTEVGPAVTATGGAVSNAGRALHRLGLTPRLIGKVGDDRLGDVTMDLLRERSESLVADMIVAEGASSSYTIVVSPPGVERIFFHCPGANATFRPHEIALEQVADARLFHFGYPPLLRQVYLDGGKSLAAVFEAVRARGTAVSLDMAVPDPDSESGGVDWTAWLARVLPHVDLFGPSLEEILFMLDRPLYEEKKEEAGDGSLAAAVEIRLLDRLASTLVGWGAPLVVLKLGDQGLYLRTAEDADSFEGLEEAVSLSPDRWIGRQFLVPPFETEVVGTTGAGDATMAGLLTGLHRGATPEEAVRGAVAVGTCSVEAQDAVSGVPQWEAVQARLQAGWGGQSIDLSHSGWSWREDPGLWVGPKDPMHSL